MSLGSLLDRLTLRTRARRLLTPFTVTSDLLRHRTSISDTPTYTELCARAAADPAVFANFKGQPAYRAILEHLTCDQGAAYLTLALEQRPDLAALLDRFRENDRIGGADTCDYGRYGRFSPTTLRYVKVVSDLLGLFGKLEGFQIIEIGGGYGGQCFVTSVVSTPASYTLIDLKPCLALQQTYLARLGVRKVRFLAANDLSQHARYDLAISNYAFSECVRETQELYMERVLQRSNRGYVTCNWMMPSHYRSFSAEELLAALPGSRFLAEEPQTARQNAILAWA